MTAGMRDASGPLAPLVEALLSGARHDAEETVAGAQADADASIAHAQRQADSLRAEARAKGRADGEAVLAGERSRAERQARGILLAAQRQVHDEARGAARDAVSALRADPGYRDVLDALRERALRELGTPARVTEHPRGGIVATAGSRRVDYSFDALADDILDRLGPEVEGIWSS
jgi:vacuolar-type H+-ATPase subunit E/Vma4